MRTPLIILLTAILTVCARTTHAQQIVSERIDSLIKASFSQPDTSKINTYATIAWETRYSNSILGLEYGTIAMQLAEKYNNAAMYQFACVAVGTIERTIGNFDEAIRIYTLGLQTAQKNGMREQLAYSYNNIGSVYMTEDSLDKAELYLGVSMFMGNCLNDSDIIGYSEQNLGIVQYKKKEYRKSLETLQEAYNIRSESNLNIRKISNIIYWISKDYLALGETRKAKQYLLDVINNNDKKEIINLDMLYYELAEIYNAENNTDSAIYYANVSRHQRLRTNSFEDNYQLLINTYYNDKNFKAASDSYRDYEFEKDSILQNTIDNQNKEIKYTSEFYKEQIEYQKLHENEKSGRIIVLISIIAAVLAILIVTNIIIFNIKNRAINKALKKQKDELDLSIEYTRDIQATMMPSVEEIGNIFSDKFVLYMPRDIVSGDFYWQYETEEYEIIAVADCTGHGVPGAMLSMLGISTLQETVKTASDPAIILEKLRDKVKELMHQDESIESQNDGMDIALIKVDKKTKMLNYSGAFIELVYIRDNEYLKLKPTQNPVGIYMSEEPYRTETLQLEPGDRIYMMTDGYSSQLGGKSKKRMNYKYFKNLLLENYQRPMSEQKDILQKAYKDWQGDAEQIDDVTIAGFTV